MVFEVGSDLDVLHGWRRGTLSRDDKFGFHPLESQLSDVPRCADSGAALDVFLRERGCLLDSKDSRDSNSRDSRDLKKTNKSRLPTHSRRFVFTPESKKSFDFQPCKVLHSPLPKRHRHRQDVDGPNTAGLSCKKRRLRADLITSRLSQSYSQPATHILNREGMESGDKRFLKMATTLDMARRIAHLHGTSFLRFSLMNRLRKKLGLWKKDEGNDDRERKKEKGAVNEEDEGDEEHASEETIDTTAKAPWRAQSLEASSGGKYLKPASPTTDRQPKSAKVPGPRLSKPTALPLPSADFAVKNGSPRIQPMRSPELRPMAHYEELDEDSFSFLHADDESAGDVPDDGDVYSDFGVIFGSPGSPAEGEDHTYEEYLDELDGISWMTR